MKTHVGTWTKYGSNTCPTCDTSSGVPDDEHIGKKSHRMGHISKIWMKNQINWCTYSHYGNKIQCQLLN